MKEFDADLAYVFALLSEISYIDQEPVLVGKLAALGFELVKRLGRSGDLSGFICRNNEYAVLVFQGTDGRDWQTIKEDLKFWHSRDQGVSYAAGFHDAYCELLPGFAEFFDTTQRPIYITGHSLGGAIALIAALNLQPYSFEACYTFGAPRVCGISGEKHDNGKTIYRIVHENDVVPSLPLVILGYWPFLGELVYITAANKLVRGWRAYALRILGQTLPILQKAVFGLPGFITSHLIGNYIEALHIIIWRADRAKRR